MSFEDSDDELIFRPYRPGEDDRKMVSLLDLVFDGWPKIGINSEPIEYFRWKYRDNPLNLVTGCVCEHMGEIISSTHTFIYKLKIGEGTHLAGIGADSCVHPDYRRRGIYNKILATKMSHESKKGIEFRFHISGNPILVKRSKRREGSSTGERIPFPHKLTQLVKIYNIDEHLAKSPLNRPFLVKYGYTAAKMLNKIFSGKPEKNSSNIRYEEVKVFDVRFEEFWRKVSPSYSFIIERTPEYLNWRYCDPRTGLFKVIAALEEDELQGYIIYTINDYTPDYLKGYIIDLITLPGREDALNGLVRKSLDYFELNEVNMVQFLVVKNHPYENALKMFGFLDSRVHWHLYYNTYVEIPEMKEIKAASPGEIHVSFENFDYV